MGPRDDACRHLSRPQSLLVPLGQSIGPFSGEGARGRGRGVCNLEGDCRHELGEGGRIGVVVPPSSQGEDEGEGHAKVALS